MTGSFHLLFVLYISVNTFGVLFVKQVLIPLHQLKAVNPSANIVNPAEKYIQVISVDNHEFWFMGFLNYEGAVTSLQESLQDSGLGSV